MGNKVCEKPMYKCAVCGGVYDSIAQRMNCEQTCLKKQEEEAKKVAERRKAAEYEARKREVDEAFNRAYELKEKFLNDYDSYTYNKPVSNNFRDVIHSFEWLL